MERRVFGIETEFGNRWGSPVVSARVDQLLDVLTCAVPGPSLGGFLANGSRVYRDCGHLELAGPECASADEVVVWDRAGEELVAAAARRSAPGFERRGVGTVTLYKHSTDGKGNEFGCHENYLVDAAVAPDEVAGRLAGFLATRGIWAGAGRWDHRAQRFTLTQRGRALEAVTGRSTLRHRPLVHLKNEPLCDARRWWRLHVLAGDANVAEVATWLKVATTHLVLRCIERRGARWRDVAPTDVRAALDSVDADVSGRGRYVTGGGRRVSALEVQRWYHGRCGTELERHGGEAWEWRAWRRWGEVLEALGADGVAGLAGVCDWATKLALLESVAARHRGGMADARVALADLEYHRLGDGHGRRLEALGGLERVSEGSQVAAALVDAPPTRAAVRGRFIAAADLRRGSASANWGQVRHGTRLLLLEDPFDDDVAAMWSWLGGDDAAPGARRAPVDVLWMPDEEW